MTQRGDYVNEWMRCSELPGADGERRHLVFAVVQIISDTGLLGVGDEAALACGIKVSDVPGILFPDSSSPKCEKCRQIADGDLPSVGEDVPAPGERETVPV